jgi:hypothetical protein
MLLGWMPSTAVSTSSRAPSESFVCQPDRGSKVRFNATATPRAGVAERSKQQRNRDVTANPHTPAVDDDDHRTSAAAGLRWLYLRASLTPAPLIVNHAATGLHPRVSSRSAPIAMCATTTSRPRRCRGARRGSGSDDRCDLALTTALTVVAPTSTGCAVSVILLSGRRFEEKHAHNP